MRPQVELTAPSSTALATPAVDARGLVCHFGHVHALDDVDLTVPRGSVHALLGTNGAGKTTMLRVVAGLQKPTGGTITVLGAEPRLASRLSCRQTVMIPSGSRSFYLRISGLENLVFFARLYGLGRRAAVARAREWLAAVGLEHAARRPVGLYSHGMQKRLAVARGLMVDPRVLVVDEATHDLDPEGAQRVRDLLSASAAAGAAVLWATQRLDEIRGFAHRVTVLHEGHARFAGTVPELTSSITTQRFQVRVRGPRADGGATLDAIRSALAIMGTVEVTADDEHFTLGLHDTVILGDALAALTRAGLDVLACREEQSLVEAALLRLTRKVPT